MILTGFSSTPRDQIEVEQIIQALNKYKCNAFRIASNPSWVTGGTRPWRPDYIDYLLANWNGYIIVDRNHHTQSDTVDWVAAEAGVYEVLELWPNNPRIIVEIVNEFVWDTQGNVWNHVAPIIANVRASGYTNQLLINKHSQENDWIPIGADYYGKHAYFNNLNDPTTEWQTLWAAEQHMVNAMAAGCIPICNTEVGAHFGEWDDFTVENVAILNEFLAWSQEQGIGNMVWLDKGIRNLPRYEELGLVLPVNPIPLPSNLGKILIAGSIAAALLGLCLRAR